MNIDTHHHRTLAFAGVLQALLLVKQTAYGQSCDNDSLETSLRSVLMLDADSVEAVYGGNGGLRSGLRLIQTQLLGDRQKPDPELSRYLVVLLHLERKLSKRDDLLERLRTGIEHAQRQSEHFDIQHPNVLAAFADTYSDTISTLRPRIMVNGDPQRLQDTNVARRVRALLLAAMRSVVLWRQCGGTRLSLLLHRTKLTEHARELLKTGYSLH